MLIKLKQPLNYKGAFCAAGTVLPVDAEFGKKIVDSGAAEYMPTAVEEQAKEAQRIAGEKTEEVQELEQALRQAIEYIETLEETLREKREQSAGKIAELEEDLAGAQKELAEAKHAAQLLAAGETKATSADTKAAKNGDR